LILEERGDLKLVQEILGHPQIIIKHIYNQNCFGMENEGSGDIVLLIDFQSKTRINREIIW